MPIDLRRRDEIAAAVAAYDRDHPDAPLPRNAGRLLAVMFRSEDVCHRSLDAIAAEGFNRNDLPATLRRLVGGRAPVQATGFRRCVPDTYRLHLPARCSHEEPPPREGVRPRPRRAAGPQRQGPHRRLRARLDRPHRQPGQHRRRHHPRLPGRSGRPAVGVPQRRSGVCFPSYETIAAKAGVCPLHRRRGASRRWSGPAC